MTNSQPIVVRAAMKPISTLARPLQSVNLQTQAGRVGLLRAERRLRRGGRQLILENVVAFEIARAVVESSAATAWKRSRPAPGPVLRNGEEETVRREVVVSFRLSVVSRCGCVVTCRGERTKRRLTACDLSPFTDRAGRLAWWRSSCFASSPTAAVVGWCVAWRSPWHTLGEARWLGRELGLTTVVGEVRHPRPGTVVYEGLALSDPESGQMILRCPRLEAVWTTINPSGASPKGAARPAIALSAAVIEIDASGWQRLSQLLARYLEGQGGPDLEFRLAAGEVKLFDRQRLWRLGGLDAGVGALPCGCQAQASFRLPGSAATDPVRIRLVRNRQALPPAYGLELSTGNGELPLALPAIGLPELQLLGPRCRFSGYGWANHGLEGWDGELTGQLLEVDLGQLLGSQFGQRLDGTADLTLQRAAVRAGRLVEAAGTLAGGPGRIGQPLVDAAIEHLRLVGPQQPTGWADVLPYSYLAVAFQLDCHGLRLAGRLSGGPARHRAAGRRRPPLRSAGRGATAAIGPGASAGPARLSVGAGQPADRMACPASTAGRGPNAGPGRGRHRAGGCGPLQAIKAKISLDIAPPFCETPRALDKGRSRPCPFHRGAPALASSITLVMGAPPVVTDASERSAVSDQLSAGGGQCSVLSTQYSVLSTRSLTPHPSYLTPHTSPLTPHPSPLTPHPSPLTPHPSPLATRHFLLPLLAALLASLSACETISTPKGSQATGWTGAAVLGCQARAGGPIGLVEPVRLSPGEAQDAQRLHRHAPSRPRLGAFPC